jgi:hypothetical protein
VAASRKNDEPVMFSNSNPAQINGGEGKINESG